MEARKVAESVQAADCSCAQLSWCPVMSECHLSLSYGCRQLGAEHLLLVAYSGIVLYITVGF